MIEIYWQHFLFINNNNNYNNNYNNNNNNYTTTTNNNTCTCNWNYIGHFHKIQGTTKYQIYFTNLSKHIYIYLGDALSSADYKVIW